MGSPNAGGGAGRRQGLGGTGNRPPNRAGARFGGNLATRQRLRRRDEIRTVAARVGRIQGQ